MKTTQGTEVQAGTAERERAWSRLAAKRGTRGRPAALRRPTPGLRLTAIAEAYDRIVTASRNLPAQDRELPKLPEADVLAALRVLRILREQLDADEAALISLARHKKITWARIARELELSGRQSAERRYLQLSLTHHPRDDGSAPTQSDRVEAAREIRRRQTEQQWATSRAATIHRLAVRLDALDDLTGRINRSATAHTIASIRAADKTSRPQPPPTRWPQALRDAITAYENARGETRGRAAPSSPADSQIPQQRETEAVHRLLGLVLWAAVTGNIDLADQPELTDDLAMFRRELR